jgi:hypothetical protein
MVLPTVNASDFLRPLLPAPLQVIGAQATEEGEAESGESGASSWTWFGQAKGAQKKKYGFSAARKMLRKAAGRKKSKGKKQPRSSPTEDVEAESMGDNSVEEIEAPETAAARFVETHRSVDVEGVLRSAQQELQRLVEDFGRATAASPGDASDENELDVSDEDHAEDENEDEDDAAGDQVGEEREAEGTDVLEEEDPVQEGRDGYEGEVDDITEDAEDAEEEEDGIDEGVEEEEVDDEDLEEPEDDADGDF